MSLLDRYLLKQFCKNIVMVMAALVSIYFLVDFFERIDNFMEANKQLSLAIRYFFLKIPFMIDMLQPVCILLAGVITLGLLNHNNEFMALKAGGISTMRIIRPLVSAALVFTFASLALAQLVLPVTMHETGRIWNEEVNHKIPKGILRKGRTYFKGSDGFYTFIRPNPKKNSFNNFCYTQMADGFQLKLFLTAETAEWQDGVWTFRQGQIKEPTPEQKNKYTLRLFEKTTLSIPENPADFFAPEYKSNEQSISQLFSQAWSKEHNSLNARINLHSRLSFIFLGLPLIFIGLPVMLIVHNNWGHDLTMAIPISCGLAFATWGWWSTSQSMAKAAYLNPAIASWALYLFICPLGYWLLRKQDL